MGGLSSYHSKISKPSAVFMIVLLCLLDKRPWCLCNPDPIQYKHSREEGRNAVGHE